MARTVKEEAIANGEESAQVTVQSLKADIYDLLVKREQIQAEAKMLLEGITKELTEKQELLASLSA